MPRVACVVQNSLDKQNTNLLAICTTGMHLGFPPPPCELFLWPRPNDQNSDEAGVVERVDVVL